MNTELNAPPPDELAEQWNPLNPNFVWKNNWNDRFIGTLPREKIAGAIFEKAKTWNQSLTHFFDRVRLNWLLFHNVDPWTGNAASFDITGDHGEYLELRINHFRNLVLHMMNLIFAKMDAFKSIARNEEPESLQAADGFNAYLEQVYKRERAGRYIHTAGLYSQLMGCGFNVYDWDASRGSPWVGQEDGRVINVGGPRVRARSLLDTAWDIGVTDWKDLPWFIEREPVNRLEFLAAHPDHEDQILSAPSIDEENDFSPSIVNGEESDCIWKWTFHHRPINSLVLGSGRRTIVIDDKDPIEDGDHPHNEIPVVRMAPMEHLGSLLGDTSANDIAPIQLFYNVVVKGMATRVAAKGSANIAAPRGADLELETLIGGANIVYYNPDMSSGGGKPEVLDLFAGIDSTTELLPLLERIMETVVGINATVRGNPDDNLKSGRAMTVAIAQTVNFMSGFHKSKIEAGEDGANILLRMGQKYLSTGQMVRMIGQEKFQRMGGVDKDSLRLVANVEVEAVDPALYTMAGRIELADKFMDTGAIKTPYEYFEVLRTGNIETLTNVTISMTRGIRDENTALLRGEYVAVLDTDDDAVHLPYHVSLTDGPEARKLIAAGKYQAVLKHILDHKLSAAKKAAETLPSAPGMPQIVSAEQTAQQAPPAAQAQPPPDQQPPT